MSTGASGSVAVDYVRAEFGDTAATAVMALVYKSVGDGPVTEENLGNGLLNALKLVDRQLGVADKLMAHFNTGVNAALNDYFDNGLNEIFYAASSSGQNPAVQALSVAENSLGSTLHSSLDEDAVVSVLDILRQSLEEGGYGPEGLRQGLDNANQWLAENRPDASPWPSKTCSPAQRPPCPPAPSSTSKSRQRDVASFSRSSVLRRGFRLSPARARLSYFRAPTAFPFYLLRA